jgi:hypothetical protein
MTRLKSLWVWFDGKKTKLGVGVVALSELIEKFQGLANVLVPFFGGDQEAVVASMRITGWCIAALGAAHVILRDPIQWMIDKLNSFRK